MQAVVLDVYWERLLVLDLNTRQRVMVLTPDARWFGIGDLVQIWYNGVMTNSIPPQINATRIVAAPQGGFSPPVRPPVFFPPVIFPPVVGPGFCLPGFCPPVGRPPVGRPPIGRPPIGRPPVGGPPGNRPPGGGPPGGRPPMRPGPGPR